MANPSLQPTSSTVLPLDQQANRAALFVSTPLSQQNRKIHKKTGFYTPRDVDTFTFLYGCRYNRDAKQRRELRTQAFAALAWNAMTCAKMAVV